MLGLFTIGSEGHGSSTEEEFRRPATTLAYGVVSLVLNFLVTGLTGMRIVRSCAAQRDLISAITAGRIYHIARTGVGDASWKKRYNVLIAML